MSTLEKLGYEKKKHDFSGKVIEYQFRKEDPQYPETIQLTVEIAQEVPGYIFFLSLLPTPVALVYGLSVTCWFVFSAFSV